MSSEKLEKVKEALPRMRPQNICNLCLSLASLEMGNEEQPFKMKNPLKKSDIGIVNGFPTVNLKMEYFAQKEKIWVKIAVKTSA